MPTYQYTCTECGEPVEAVQKFTDDPLTECPACGGRLRKVFSPVGIVFKGSGFYRTDSRKNNTAMDPAASKDGGQDKDKDKSSSDAGSSSAGDSGSSASSSDSGSGSSSSDKTAAKKPDTSSSTSSKAPSEKVA